MRSYLVKLVNTTNTIVGQHQSTSLDTELACLDVTYDGGRETRSR